MSGTYDVVIAGAGPAGAQCARDLAARNYDVVVLETEAEADFPRQSNKSTAGTFPSMMASFGVPDDVVMNYTDSVVLESPTDYYVQDQPGAVLEFADFKRWLVAEGRADGAEYRFDARATKPIIENGSVAGVTYNGSEDVYGDIVIDATGPSAPLASALGVTELERPNQAIGIEYEFDNVVINHPQYADLTDAMMLRLDHRMAPGGYSWIFHTGGQTAKVGVCYIQNERYQEYGSGRTIDGYLEYWLESDPRFANAEPFEGKQHRGSAHIQYPTRLSTDSFMAIGDTVPTVDPLWGEGIHKGMLSARAAAIAADRALQLDEPNTSASMMQTYDELWHQMVAPHARVRLLMTKLLYLAPNSRYDQFMADLRKLDDGTLKKANNGHPLSIMRLVHAGDISLLSRYVKDELGPNPLATVKGRAGRTAGALSSLFR